MAGMPRVMPCTFDEFCAVVQDGDKADLIDGIIYMASPDNTDANDLFVWLLRLIGDFVELKDLGKLYGSRVAFRISETYAPEPDIAFLRTERFHLVQRGYVDGPPDLAIEIVSPDSIERDYSVKRQVYREAGVAEYWIIDEVEQSVTLLRLVGKSYREIKPRSGTLRSEVLAGFWLRPEWLWETPLPPKAAVLGEILDILA